MFVVKVFSVTVAPICAAFCSRAVADMCGDPAARWSPFSSNMFELSWRDGEEVDERLLENTVPAMVVLLLKGFGAGIGISSCGSDNGCLFSALLLNSDVPGLGTMLVLIGSEETRFGICWHCKFGPIFGNCPSLALLFSSASASQKALCVMKLSLLQRKIST